MALKTAQPGFQNYISWVSTQSHVLKKKYEAWIQSHMYKTSSCWLHCYICTNEIKRKSLHIKIHTWWFLVRYFTESSNHYSKTHKLKKKWRKKNSLSEVTAFRSCREWLADKGCENGVSGQASVHDHSCISLGFDARTLYTVLNELVEVWVKDLKCQSSGDSTVA